MSKLRLPVVVVFLAFFMFSASAMAAEKPAKFNTDSGSIQGVAVTTSQCAVFAAFLSDVDSGAGANTAISVSNIVITPPTIPGITNGDLSDNQGTITAYLYGQDGNAYVYNTGDNPTVGLGLDENGELGPGGTWTVLATDIFGTMEVTDFSGFGWFVGNFDSCAGTYTNFFTGLATGFGANMVPAPGGIPTNP